MASGGRRHATGFVAFVVTVSWALGCSASLGSTPSTIAPATFRVSYNAEVDISASSCDAHFVEGWTFPYTTGGQTWRDIGLDKDQRVSNVYVTASPSYNLQYKYGWNDGAWRIAWYTSPTSLSYTVSYDKDNAVRQCGANATLGVPGTYTARFATGKWTQQMNALTVVFKLVFVPSVAPILALKVDGVTRAVNSKYSPNNAGGATVTATLNGPLLSGQNAAFTLTYDYGPNAGPTCSCTSGSGNSGGTGSLVGGIIAGVVVLLLLLSCGIGCLGLCMSTKTTCPCSRCNGCGYMGAGVSAPPPLMNGMYRGVAPSSPPAPPGFYDQAPVTGVPYHAQPPQMDTKGYPPGTSYPLSTSFAPNTSNLPDASSSAYPFPPPPPPGYSQAPPGYNPGYYPGYSQAPQGFPPVGPTGYPPHPFLPPPPPPGYPGATTYGQQQFGAPPINVPMQPPGTIPCPQCQGRGTEVRRTIPAWAKLFGAIGIACFM